MLDEQKLVEELEKRAVKANDLAKQYSAVDENAKALEYTVKALIYREILHDIYHVKFKQKKLKGEKD